MKWRILEDISLWINLIYWLFYLVQNYILCNSLKSMDYAEVVITQ
jgi:hypothetical protein